MFMKKSVGNIGNVMITGFCMLAMTVLMLSYMDNMQLIQQKMQVSQLARKYILKMETEGYLIPSARVALTEELQELGVTEVAYDGTTLEAISYGEPITLQIQGKLREKYEFAEKRASTAKN